jgi:hypothetical protein
MVKINRYKLLELYPEIKEIKEGGEIGKVTTQNIKKIIGAKLQKI